MKWWDMFNTKRDKERPEEPDVMLNALDHWDPALEELESDDV